MIGKVMDKINNHFVMSIESRNYAIETDGIVGSFQETYLPGMYIKIFDSYLNDGVYEIQSVSDAKITTVETLQAEDTPDNIILFALSPPQDFIDLVNEIENFNESVGASSESIDDYSITYADGKDGSWESAFSSKLSTYRRVYTDIKIPYNYKWQDRV